MFPEALSRLIAEFKKLPSVGMKSAMRYAYCVLEMSDEEAEDFADSILEVRKKIHICPICGDYTEYKYIYSTFIAIGFPQCGQIIEVLLLVDSSKRAVIDTSKAIAIFSNV